MDGVRGREARHPGRRELAAELLDPDSARLYVRALDRASAFRAWEITDERPPAGEEYIGGNFGEMPLAGLGVLAALDMRTNRLVSGCSPWTARSSRSSAAASLSRDRN